MFNKICYLLSIILLISIYIINQPYEHTKETISKHNESLSGVGRLPTHKERPFTIESVEASAYNVGDPLQNWGNPCVGAFNTNLCEYIANDNCGIASTDFLPLGTYVYIRYFGLCRVVDRLNKRYNDKKMIDIAFNNTPKEKQEALNFGRQTLNIKVYK